jgi:hypothetical protein
MKTPVDCQLLMLGLDFVRVIRGGDLDKALELTGSEDGRKKAGILVANENYRSLMENFSFLHAVVDDAKRPEVKLRFLETGNEPFSQTLICSAIDKDEAIKIVVCVKRQGIFVDLTFHRLDVSSTCHFIDLLFHRHAILLTRHFIDLPFHQLAAS